MLATCTEPVKATTNYFQGDGQSNTPRVTGFGDHQELRCASFYQTLPDAYALVLKQPRMSELGEKGPTRKDSAGSTFYIVSPAFA